MQVGKECCAGNFRTFYLAYIRCVTVSMRNAVTR